MKEREDVIRRMGTVTKVHGGTYEIEDDETKRKILCT